MIHRYGDPDSVESYWNDDVTAAAVEAGVYVAITGNTGSGKSTLVAELTRLLRQRGVRAIGINERCLHHPLLGLMFYRPRKYAFGVQLNFLIQRHLMLSRWLELGYTVVIERSHLDDRLFMETHLQEGNIDPDEFAAYDSLFRALAARLPDPNALVFLDASPEVSLARLKASELACERPKEFPDEETKRHLVTEWQLRFRRHYSDLLSKKAAGQLCTKTKFFSWLAETPTSEIASALMSNLAP